MKEAASHQVEAVTDATNALSKGIRKSFKRHSKEASRFARSLSELVDVEDMLNTIHKAAYRSEHGKSANIIHPPIDWSKHHPSASVPSSTNPSTSANPSKVANSQSSSTKLPTDSDQHSSSTNLSKDSDGNSSTEQSKGHRSSSLNHSKDHSDRRLTSITRSTRHLTRRSNSINHTKEYFDDNPSYTHHSEDNVNYRSTLINQNPPSNRSKDLGYHSSSIKHSKSFSDHHSSKINSKGYLSQRSSSMNHSKDYPDRPSSSILKEHSLHRSSSMRHSKNY